MPTLPAELAFIILAFRPLFSHRVWGCVQILLIGAILAPGKRTVTSVLRVMGLSDEAHFQNYHRALNRAVWNCRHAGLVLLRMLLTAFVPSGPLVLGLDDTIERRWGARIRARGIYRDPVRSSDSHFVKTSGLRWLSLMLLAEIPWAGRVWALPFLTALAPSQRYWQKEGHKPKLLTDWARQLVLQVQRWFPNRTLVVVTDGAFASLQLLSQWAARRRPIVCITRLRLDARLFRPAPPRKKGAMGRPRLVGTRLPSLHHVLANRRTKWQRLFVNDWYGQGRRLVELTSGTAVWYHTGLPPVPIRWVLVRDPKGKFETRALLCTQLDQHPRHSAVVPLALASGGDIPGSAQPSRSGDATSMVRSGHCAHYAGLAGPVLNRDVTGTSSGPQRSAPDSSGCLVYQDTSHLLRCHRSSTPATLASS